MIWIIETVLTKLNVLRMVFGMRCCFSIFFMLCAMTVHGAEELAATGTRAIGIGGAFIGVADDENAVRRNPAGLTRLDRYAVGFEQTPSGLFDALQTSYLSAVLPTSEKMALGIDWLQVGIEDEELNSNRDSFNFAYSLCPFVSVVPWGESEILYVVNCARWQIKGSSNGLGHGCWSSVPAPSPLEVGGTCTKFHRFWIWGRIKLRHLDTSRFRCQRKGVPDCIQALVSRITPFQIG